MNLALTPEEAQIVLFMCDQWIDKSDDERDITIESDHHETPEDMLEMVSTIEQTTSRVGSMRAKLWKAMSGA